MYKKQHELASDDLETYVSNPINAYLLVKRLTADWKQVESLIGMRIGEGTMQNLLTC